MGTDNLFHKRKARTARQLSRRKARRAPYAKVLIVCEGEKTEPHYFSGLKDHYELNSANVEICGDCGSDPVGIVNYGKQRYREERDVGDAFDKVYCVFDKDAHTNYQRAIDLIRGATPKDTFVAINSVPCFEYWLLLHFDYTTQPFSGQLGKSACAQVIDALKNFIPDYAKGDGDIFPRLVDQLPFAIDNAERALRAATANDTDNPTTRVHELVRFLQTEPDRQGP